VRWAWIAIRLLATALELLAWWEIKARLEGNTGRSALTSTHNYRQNQGASSHAQTTDTASRGASTTEDQQMTCFTRGSAPWGGGGCTVNNSFTMLSPSICLYLGCIGVYLTDPRGLTNPLVRIMPNPTLRLSPIAFKVKARTSSRMAITWPSHDHPTSSCPLRTPILVGPNHT